MNINIELIKQLGLTTPESIAQYVIDNRWNYSYLSNFELYHIVLDAINLLNQTNHANN